MNPLDPSATDQTVLFRHRRGGRIRWMARSASAMGLLVSATAIATLMVSAWTHGLDTLSPGPVVAGLLVSLCGFAFALLSCRLSRQFVTHLEIWPRSNLAVVRTAGCWRERLQLHGWNEFRTGDLQELAQVARSRRDPLLRVDLRSGVRLAFDHHGGEAPHGWAALYRFIEKCSVPKFDQAAPTATLLELPSFGGRAAADPSQS